MTLRWPPVLMYHAVSRPTEDPENVCVSSERFKAQMLYLARNNLRGVSMRDLRRAVAAGDTSGLVGLTFDDGYENFLHNALPVLEELAFSATVFVVCGKAGGENDWDPAPRMRLLGTDDIREISRRGIEVGSHTMSHIRLSEVGTEVLEREIFRSRQVLDEVLGEAVEGFCYPYGDLDLEAAESVQRAGYSYACAYKERVEETAYDIPRIFVGEKDGWLRLMLKLRWYPAYTRVVRALNFGFAPK